MALAPQTPLNPPSGIDGRSATGSAGIHAHSWFQGMPFTAGPTISYFWHCSCGRTVLSPTKPATDATSGAPVAV
jgi:hypothetical protein